MEHGPIAAVWTPFDFIEMASFSRESPIRKRAIAPASEFSALPKPIPQPAWKQLDCRFRVVGNDHFRCSTKELQSAHMRFDPAGEILAAGGFGKGVAAGAENRDKQGGIEIHFTGLLVIDGDLVASIINE